MASVEETSDVQPVSFERSSTLLFTNTPGVQFLYLGRQCCICFTNCTPTFSIPLDSRWPGEDLGEEEKLSTLKSKHIRWGQVLWYIQVLIRWRVSKQELRCLPCPRTQLWSPLPTSTSTCTPHPASHTQVKKQAELLLGHHVDAYFAFWTARQQTICSVPNSSDGLIFVKRRARF